MANKKPKTKGVAPKKKSTKPSDESLADRKKRAKKILSGLNKLYHNADCGLTHNSALELLIATILSAQCTDETVNKVVPVLLAKYPNAAKLAVAKPSDVEKIIRPTGFFRQKTKSIISVCRQIIEEYDGEVPATMDELLTLRGVARKTANVVLGTWFKKNVGVVVDTHVGRLAHRLGLTWTSKHEKDAVKIEQDLMQVFPQAKWTFVAHALIWHGRRVCTARKPNCAGCILNKLCPSAFTINSNNNSAKKAKRSRGA